MAKLILTGMHEAIDLKKLHGEQVLMMDKAAVDAADSDGLWLIGHRGGVLQFLRSLATRQFYPLQPRKRLPTA